MFELGKIDSSDQKNSKRLVPREAILKECNWCKNGYRFPAKVRNAN